VAGWTDELPVTKSISLPPDPRILESLGRNHDLETAVADLVDNSVDAGAEHVLVRFVKNAAGLAAFYVVDDGWGMDDSSIDIAMTIGGNRDYRESDLGHFGLGLKAASFSHADSLSVFSAKAGELAVGRRWLLSKATSAFECDVIDQSFCAAELELDYGFDVPHGTVVRWDKVRSFPSSRDPQVTERYLQNSIDALRLHLGLVFHRFLTAERLQIRIDVFDVFYDELGPPFEVEAVDPFAYHHSGHHLYPAVLAGRLGGRDLKLQCHIWPGRSVIREFRLGSSTPERYQGFYFYRRDRLVQIGGWNGVGNIERDLQLARVAIEFEEVASPDVRMNPEKFRVDVGPSFTEAVEAAHNKDGLDFNDYLDDARSVFKLSRKRNRARPRVIEPGKGIHPRVRRAISRELEYVQGEDPIEIRWARFSDDSFFEVDREASTLWLNAAYRQAISGSASWWPERCSANQDSPVSPYGRARLSGSDPGSS
jgi:hypothetical protein